jgi:5-methylcytosine-specific restriction endonuclease McrA
MARRGPCREWPNCECPKCDRYRNRLENVRNGLGKPTKVIGACHYCGDLATTRDHVIPRSKGGGGAGNIVPACEPCNRRKGSMDYRDFMHSIGEKI